MTEIIWTGSIFFSGFISYMIYDWAHTAILHRINYGKKVVIGNKAIGYTVSLRYRGRKRFAYVDNLGNLSGTCFHDRDQAASACKEIYLKNAPRQTSFARAV